MSLFDSLRYRWRVLLHPRDYARQQDDELDFHLQLEAMQRAHAARGALSGDDATHAARRRFGNVLGTKEEARRMSGLGPFDAAAQDLRFAIRAFRRTPGFSAVAVLTLAIGIGANTAIFSAVNAMLFRPLPFRDPEQLMEVSLTRPAWNGQPASDDRVWSYLKFAVLRANQQVFSELDLSTDDEVTLTVGGEPDRVRNEIVGARYLPTLGVVPMLGRNFLAEENQRPDGSANVAVLGNALWERRYNADPAIIGTAVTIDGKPFTVVGVLPPGFKGLSGRAEIFLPLMSRGEAIATQAWSHAFTLTARRKAGVSVEQAQAAVVRLGQMVDAAYPHPESATQHWGAAARPLDARRVDPLVRQSLLVLLAAVGLVLLAACANVANLFLVRAAGREREIAVRIAVGAGRGRVIRQLLTESLLLSFAGGAAGLAVAWWGVKALAAMNPAHALAVEALSGIGAVNFSTIHLDVTAFSFAAALALLTGVIFGLVPALAATKPSLSGALKGAAVRQDRRWFTSRNVLAVSEIAISLVLLAGSGLMVRSLSRLLAVDPGFDASHMLTMRFHAPSAVAEDSLPQFYDQLLTRLGALPGVTAVTLTDCPPLNGGCNITIADLRDRPAVPRGSEPLVGVHWITPQWTQVMRVPLVKGRMFSDADRMGAPHVILVSETAARKLWPGQDPLGRPVGIGQGGFYKDTAYVIGVVGDVRYGTLDALPDADVYISYYQSMRGRMRIFMRTTGDPLMLAGAARRVAHELNASEPLFEVRTMESRVADSTSSMRFRALLLGLFALMALALAVMGTYGVISYAVSQRTKEIGVRVALGATRGDVIRMVVGQGVLVAVAGALVGLLAAFGTTRVLGSLLYGVGTADPVTFLGIVVVLVGAVLLASWIPARRAARIDPTEALRSE
jgi:predicted permease